MVRFSECIDWVLDNEGGYTDNHQDRGGCTNLGITLRDCLEYPRSGINTCEELKRISIATAKEIFFNKYWNSQCGQLNDRRIATKIFDMAVNIGPFYVVLVQRALVQCGVKVKTDGIFGPKTVDGTNSVDPEIYLEELVQQLLTYYDKIIDHNPSQVVFVNGWHNRARKLPV